MATPNRQELYDPAATLSAVDPGDPEDIRSTGGAERDAGGNDDALAWLSDPFAVSDPHRLLHHVSETLDVTGVHAVRAPQNSQASRRVEVRSQHQDRGLRPLPSGSQGCCARSRIGNDSGRTNEARDLSRGGADRVGSGVLMFDTRALQRRVVERILLYPAGDAVHDLDGFDRIASGCRF